MKTIYPEQKTLKIKRELAPDPVEKMEDGTTNRCKMMGTKGGRQWQCKKKARENYDYCAVHGVGYLARELNKERPSTALAHMGSGAHASPEALRELFTTRPDFQALYDVQLRSTSLLDYREEVALSKALLRFFIKEADVTDTDTRSGRVPPALAAIDRLEKVLAIGERALKIEDRLGAITREELRYYFKCVAETLDRFVDSSRHDEARIFLARRLREANLAGVGGDQAIPISGNRVPDEEEGET